MNSIVTKRLIIRRPQVRDLKDFLVYRNDEDNLRFQTDEKIDENKALRFLINQMHLNSETETGWIMFAVELLETKEMIGEVGVFLFPEEKLKGNMGWSLNKNFWGHGYAAEAVVALLKYVFDLRQLDFVTATCSSDNIASLRLMKRIGMQQFSSSIDTHSEESNSCDERVYKLSREHWEHPGFFENQCLSDFE